MHLLLGTGELRGSFDGLVGFTDEGEVPGGVEPAASTMFGPFVADQARTRHDVEHAPDFSLGGLRVDRTELGPTALELGPETMGDEAEAAVGAALEVVALSGRGGAILGGPGEAEDVVVEDAGFAAGLVAPRLGGGGQSDDSKTE